MNNTLDYTLPAYWASYLINGDDSGMFEKDKRDCADFLAKEGISASDFVDCGESYFSWRNDATDLGGDVCDFVCVVRN